MVNYNPNQQFPLNKTAVIQWQMMNSGQAAGGYTVKPEEMITFIVPPDLVPPRGAGWGSGNDTPLLTMDQNGLITDLKGPPPPFGVFNQQPAGTIINKYTQVLGVSYTDFCGNKQDINLGTFTVTYQMSNDGSPTWTCTVTPVPQ